MSHPLILSLDNPIPLKSLKILVVFNSRKDCRFHSHQKKCPKNDSFHSVVPLNLINATPTRFPTPPSKAFLMITTTTVIKA